MRQLTTEEIERLKKEHIRLLNEIDSQTEAKKDMAKSYNQMINEYWAKESEVRHMLETGCAVPEQLDLIPIYDDDTTITFTTADGKSATTNAEGLRRAAENIANISDHKK